MNKKAAIIAGIAIVGLVGAFALSNKKGITPDNNVAAESTMTIAHDLGETKVEKNPDRVVVFDIPTLDTMEVLGIDNVVGVPTSTYPENLSKYESDEYTKVGTVKEVDLEAIKSADPDLIIIGGRQAEDIDSFKEIAPTVNLAVDGQDYMNSFKTVVTDLGKLFDKEDEAKKAIDEIEAKIEKVNKTVKEKGLTASVVMANEGNISAFSAKSRYGLIYNGLGFAEVDKNIDDSTHGQQVSFEYFLENKSDYVFVVDRGAVTGKGEAASKLFDNEVMNKTEVAKNGNIVYLNSVIWYTMTGGIESTNQMIDEIADAVK